MEKRAAWRWMGAWIAAFVLALSGCGGGGADGGATGGTGGGATGGGPGPGTAALAITAQPQDASASAGQAATFSVAVTGGTSAPTYQWRLNGTAIAGATAASYTTASTAAGDSGGKYSVVVSSGSEKVTSADATLTVKPVAVSSAYFLLASAGPQGASLPIDFANGQQSTAMPALRAIDAAAPAGPAITLEAAGQTATFLNTQLLFEGSVVAGRVTNLHSRLGTYFKNGRLFLVDQVTAAGRTPASRLVSTLASTDVCGDGGYPIMDTYGSGKDLADATRSWLFFRAPGADMQCGTADDIFLAVRMNMAAGDLPLTTGEPLAGILDADGAFDGLLVRYGAEIVRRDAALTNPVPLFNVDPATFMNLGTPWGLQAGLWLYIDGARLRGINTTVPGSPVTLVTLAAGETLAPTSAGDAAHVYMAINGAAGARVIAIGQALTVDTIATLSAPLLQLALTPTRLIMVTGGSAASGAVLSVPKAGGATTSLGSFVASAPVNPVIVSGEGVYFPSNSFTSGFNTVVVNSDGSHPVTLTDTELLKGIGASSFGLSDGSAVNYHAVLLAEGAALRQGPATLRAVTGDAASPLVTYGDFATIGPVLAPMLNPDPLQYGQPGLISMPNGDSIDLYFYRSDAAGLVHVAN